MKSKLLNKNAYESVCRNCRHGRLSPEGDSVLCVKKGITDPDGNCRRYSYDPLKRIPRKPLTVSSANPEDFDLNIGFEMPAQTAETVATESSESDTYEEAEANEPEADDEAEYEYEHEVQGDDLSVNQYIGSEDETPKTLWTQTKLSDMDESE